MRANPNRGFDHQERRAELENPTTIRFGSQVAILVPEPSNHDADAIADYLHEVVVVLRDVLHGGPEQPLLLIPTAEGGASIVTKTSTVAATATLAEVLGRIEDRHNTNPFVFFAGPAQFSKRPPKAAAIPAAAWGEAEVTVS